MDSARGRRRTATITAALSTHGWVHRQDLLDAGWRPDGLRAAVRRERLVVARRSWILHPDAAASVHLAARTGGRVTCVSAAGLLGLWRPGHATTTHVALPPHSGSGIPEGADAVAHRSIGVVAAAPRSLLDTIENTLACTAACLPYEDALAVWESALNSGATTRAHLANVPWRDAHSRRLSHEAGRLSHSGLETLFVVRMHRVGVAVRQQVHLHGHDVDGLIGERLVVQVDGYEFHRDAAQRRSDIAHDRALRLLGYTVLRFDYHQIVNDWTQVEAQVLSAIAQGLHRVPRR